MTSKWKDLFGEDYAGVMNTAKINRGGLTGGIFAEASGGKIYSRAAQVTFSDSPSRIFNPIEWSAFLNALGLLPFLL